jgi:hypothetical protein
MSLREQIHAAAQIPIKSAVEEIISISSIRDHNGRALA